jgi:hypothetical protein
VPGTGTNINTGTPLDAHSRQHLRSSTILVRSLIPTLGVTEALAVAHFAQDVHNVLLLEAAKSEAGDRV